MKFSYYRKLDPRGRRIYDRSDAAGPIAVPRAGELVPLVAGVAASLRQDDRSRTEEAVQRLVATVLHRLQVPAVRTRVLAVRPSNHREELHGLYEYGGHRHQPVITVWMRTAQRRQTVAFRSFMRTLLHEVVHHLDYQLLHLEDSYHTEGFYRRAEGLYRQLVPAELSARAAEPRPALAPRARPREAASPPARRIAARPPACPARPEPVPAAAEEQLVLPFLEP